MVVESEGEEYNATLWPARSLFSNSRITCDPAGTVIVDWSKAKFSALIFTRSPWTSAGDEEGLPGAVVGVAISPEGDGPGVIAVSGIPVVMIVWGICIVVPVGATVVDGSVVGTGLIPPPGCEVQPAHMIAVPMMQIRRMRYC